MYLIFHHFFLLLAPLLAPLTKTILWIFLTSKYLVANLLLEPPTGFEPLAFALTIYVTTRQIGSYYIIGKYPRIPLTSLCYELNNITLVLHDIACFKISKKDLIKKHAVKISRDFIYVRFIAGK